MGVCITDAEGNEIENTSKNEKPLRDEYQRPAEGYVEPRLEHVVPDSDRQQPRNDKWHPGLNIRP